jgi:hypothetical protein
MRNCEFEDIRKERNCYFELSPSISKINLIIIVIIIIIIVIIIIITIAINSMIVIITILGNTHER